MTNKPGLLPKWLFMYTALKTMYTLAIYRDHFNIFSNVRRSGSTCIYLECLLGIFRLLASRKVTRFGFYFSIAASFLVEGLFFAYEGFTKMYSLRKVFFEAFIALFTVGWMVFLYPYYLLEDKELKRD